MDQSHGTKAHDNIIMPCKKRNTEFPETLHFFVKSKEFDSTNGAIKVLLKSFHLYE